LCRAEDETRRAAAILLREAASQALSVLCRTEAESRWPVENGGEASVNEYIYTVFGREKFLLYMKM